MQGRHARCGGRVDDVGLAAASSRQFADACRGGRGDVEHDFAARDEPLRQMPTEPACALDCPAPLGELPRPTHQLAIARQRRVDPERRCRRVRCGVYGVGRVGQLVGIDPDDHGCSFLLAFPVGEQRSACRLSDPTSGISPLLSQTATGRRPGGKPWESQPEGGRRFTSQPGQRPTGSYEHQPATTGAPDTSRRFSPWWV